MSFKKSEHNHTEIVVVAAIVVVGVEVVVDVFVVVI